MIRQTVIALIVTLMGQQAVAEATAPIALQDQDLGVENAHQIDARCSSIMRLMAEVGRTQGSQRVEAYQNASQFFAIMTGTNAEMHLNDLDTTPQVFARQLIEADYERTLSAIEANDQKEIVRFSKDVLFCSQRAQAYEALEKSQ